MSGAPPLRPRSSEYLNALQIGEHEKHGELGEGQGDTSGN